MKNTDLVVSKVQENAIELLSEYYENLSSLSYDTIITMREDIRTLKGVRKDTIGNASNHLFFVGTKKE